MTPLRQRMIEDMQIRNFSPETIKGYVFHVAQFAKHFNQSPDLLGVDEIRQYQVYLLRERKVAASTLNLVLSALRFFYKVTLGREWALEHLRYPRRANPARGGTSGVEQTRGVPPVLRGWQPEAPDAADDAVRHGDEGVGGHPSSGGGH